MHVNSVSHVISFLSCVEKSVADTTDLHPAVVRECFCKCRVAVSSCLLRASYCDKLGRVFRRCSWAAEAGALSPAARRVYRKSECRAVELQDLFDRFVTAVGPC